MCNYCEKMNIAKALDFAIRDYDNDYSCGYSINGREYWNYMSNDSWKEFMREMLQEHKDQFNNAGGGELREKNSRWGWMPPKMASFGSSSRIRYNLSKDTPGFVFEKQLPTYVGHPANLDSYLLHNNTAFFVEAKCREIYGSHAGLNISNSYRDVYDFINQENPSFDFESKAGKDQDHFKCTFSYGEKDIKHFDLKQLICHFLGITADLIENKHKFNNIKFIYLIFNPEKNTDFSNSAIESFEKKLKEEYENTISEVKEIDIIQLFYTIMEFQCKKLNHPVVKCNFDFRLMDQEEYKNLPYRDFLPNTTSQLTSL